MKKIHKIQIVFFLVFSVVFVSCKDSIWGNFDNPLDPSNSSDSNDQTFAVTSVSVQATAWCTVNKTCQLTATVMPSYATDSSVTWSSSDTSVATVSSTGLVSGKALGAAIITVTTKDGGYTSFSALTVDNFPFTESSLFATTTYGKTTMYLTSIAMSADGTRLSGCAALGPLYTSADGGSSWVVRSTAGSLNWGGIAISDDGTKIAAYVSNAYILRSTDSGATWSVCTSAGIQSWFHIAMSSSGSTIAACANTGYVYISTDSGSTWTAQTALGSQNWSSISVSADGTKIIAADESSSGRLYYSTNSGSTWIALTTPVTGYWTSGLISRDGSILLGCWSSSALYRSTDGGSSWTAITPSLAAKTSPSFALSQNGSQIACRNSGSFYLSTDSGSTWTSSTRTGLYGSNFCMSADGTKILFSNNSSLYTYNGN